MAPPVTPSPHRFLAGQQRASPPKDSRTPTTLPKPATRSVQSQQTPARHAVSASQFAPTPRFSFGRSKAPGATTQRSPSPQKPAVIEAFRASGRPTEDVEDSYAHSENDEMLDGEHTSAVPTTERDIYESDTNQQWTNDLALSPKRRRLDEDDAFSSTTKTTFKRPQTPASHLPKPAPHFTHSQAPLSQASTSAEGVSHQRPSFLRPSTAPQEPSEPLPETFSPHKRGQKFVAGGMAATAQQWVVEAGQSAVQSRKGQGYLKGEDYVLRVKVDQFKGNGPFTLRGKSLNGDGVNVLLTGNGTANELACGSIVGIRAPTWEIELDGKTWTVGVDWRLLS